ncbi:MAG: dTDP-4-dehydrorhamnose reductase [Desulfatiglandaceae bacterium]
MKILITGATGQLGSDCKEVLKQRFEIIPLGSKDLDITSRGDVEDLIETTAPEVILNCAAFTRVDGCETQQDSAWRVNVDGPHNLARAAKKQGIHLIHISSDYVFDGEKPVPEPYTETDETNPLSYYGKTKWEGERAVRRGTDHHTILRTAWLYGIEGQNFLKTMLKLILKEPAKEIRVVNDQFGSPTWSYRLAQQIAGLMEAGAQGTYHATSEGYGTWYELATDFLDQMHIPHALTPCTTAEYPTPARRPINSILENRRLKKANLNRMKDWRSDLAQFIHRFRSRLMDEMKEEQE